MTALLELLSIPKPDIVTVLPPAIPYVPFKFIVVLLLPALIVFVNFVGKNSTLPKPNVKLYSTI